MNVSPEVLNARRERQATLKAEYLTDPHRALVTYKVQGVVDVPAANVRIETGRGPSLLAGLHPAAGGEPGTACAAEILLEALTACAGITFAAVANATRLPLTHVLLRVEGDVDFRGTLGVDRSVPVGMTAIRLVFHLPHGVVLNESQTNRLLQGTDRYCVVRRSLDPALPVDLQIVIDPIETAQPIASV